MSNIILFSFIFLYLSSSLSRMIGFSPMEVISIASNTIFFSCPLPCASVVEKGKRGESLVKEKGNATICN